MFYTVSRINLRYGKYITPTHWRELFSNDYEVNSEECEHAFYLVPGFQFYSSMIELSKDCSQSVLMLGVYHSHHKLEANERLYALC